MHDRSRLSGKLRRIVPDLARRSCTAGGNAVGTDPQHLRMFVLSHLCGPLIGLALSGFLLMLGFPVDGRLIGFTTLVCLFWIYPALLAIGVPYRLLSLASLQHLTLVILWAAHGYGGLTSPFLLWLAIVPLLAFLYSAPRIGLWLIILGMLTLNVAVFAALALWLAAPPVVPLPALRWLAGLSLLSASAYVWMMASYFGRVLNSRNEMAQEVARRHAHVAQLDRRATDLRQIRSAKAASLARLVDRCREPLNQIVEDSRSETGGATHQASQSASDLLSVEEAAGRLVAMLVRIDSYIGNLSAVGRTQPPKP